MNKARGRGLAFPLGVARGGGLLERGLGGLELAVELQERAVLELGCDSLSFSLFWWWFLFEEREGKRESESFFSPKKKLEKN